MFLDSLTLFFKYARNAVEETPELWVSRALVIDEFDFDRLHWGHGKYGLCHSSPKTTQEPFAGGQVAILVHIVFF